MVKGRVSRPGNYSGLGECPTRAILRTGRGQRPLARRLGATAQGQDLGSQALRQVRPRRNDFPQVRVDCGFLRTRSRACCTALCSAVHDHSTEVAVLVRCCGKSFHALRA